jgi:hypothetical protein
LGRRRFHRLAGTLIAAAATLSACSVAQNYTYVTDSGDSAYIKVPPAWRPVDQHLLGAHPVADGNDRNVLETALGQRAETHLAALAERTKVLLAEHRADVLAVGHALEMHKTISGQDVTAIIDGSQGPLVDGRPYKTPEFAAELESYHQQVLAAHYGSDGSLPLPVPAPAAVELDAISAMNPQAQLKISTDPA